MSPQVQLVCYPSSDRAFADAAMSLTVDLPVGVSFDEMAHAVQTQLRGRHPDVVVLVGEQSGDGVVWHVYRDGAPG